MSDGGRKVRIWDLPTRLFHWSLVALVLFSYVTGDIGGIDVTVPEGLPGAGTLIHDIKFHLWSGLAILTLVLFRIAWGLIGSSSARFSSFVRGPGQVIDYLRRMFSRGPAMFVPGHNPAGAVMILVVLALLLIQGCTGLFLRMDDEYSPFSGPLTGYVSAATAKLLLKLHSLTWTIVSILILLHIAAIVYYWLVRRENLIPAMFHGRREVPLGTRAPALTFAPMLRAALLLLVAAAIVWAVVTLGGANAS
jgi:cytochrome b